MAPRQGFQHSIYSFNITALKQLANRLLYHAYSIWLFTFSDLKTIIGPKTAFGMINALSTRAFLIPLEPQASQILYRTPRVLFWVWINLLPFEMDNQRQPASIIEDTANKPWRVLPSKRLSPERARLWMLVLYPCAFLASLTLGGVKQCLALMFLGAWYNDFGGADCHFLVRNLINAGGYVSYASGAMEIALGGSLIPSQRLISWFAILGLVVLTSVHSQDLEDQEGDRLRGRKSAPLTIGDTLSRQSIALSMSFFSIYCPWFWGLRPSMYICPTLLGTFVGRRIMASSSLAEDKTNFRFWNLWMALLYCLPLLKTYEARLYGPLQSQGPSARSLM